METETEHDYIDRDELYLPVITGRFTVSRKVYSIDSLENNESDSEPPHGRDSSPSSAGVEPDIKIEDYAESKVEESNEIKTEAINIENTLLLGQKSLTIVLERCDQGCSTTSGATTEAHYEYDINLALLARQGTIDDKGTSSDVADAEQLSQKCSTTSDSIPTEAYYDCDDVKVEDFHINPAFLVSQGTINNKGTSSDVADAEQLSQMCSTTSDSIPTEAYYDCDEVKVEDFHINPALFISQGTIDDKGTSSDVEDAKQLFQAYCDYDEIKIEEFDIDAALLARRMALSIAAPECYEQGRSATPSDAPAEDCDYKIIKIDDNFDCEMGLLATEPTIINALEHNDLEHSTIPSVETLDYDRIDDALLMTGQKTLIIVLERCDQGCDSAPAGNLVETHSPEHVEGALREVQRTLTINLRRCDQAEVNEIRSKLSSAHLGSSPTERSSLTITEQLVTAHNPKKTLARTPCSRSGENTGEKKHFACDQCSYSCHQIKALKRHKLIHTGEKPFACDLCSYKSNQNINLKRHKLKHTSKKPFACDQCSFSSNQKSNLTSHLLVHSIDKPFSCDLCAYKCNQKKYLIKHMGTHTGKDNYTCNQCPYACIQKYDLKRHALIHSDKRLHACDQCSYTCNQKNDLKKHNLLHTGEKPFACQQCLFKCNQKINLKRHILTHIGKNLFLCDQCAYTCKNKKLLAKHMLMCGMQFSCGQCSYSSNLKCNLKRHSLLHDVENSFACDHCSYTSKYKTSLKIHKRNHIDIRELRSNHKGSSTDPRLFICDGCSFRCYTRNVLEQHMHVCVYIRKNVCFDY